MATTYKILGQVSPTDTSNTDLYTVPTGYSSVVSTLSVTNIGTNATAATVYVRKNGAAAGDVNTLVPGTLIDAKSFNPITVGLTLAAGDIVTVKSGIASSLTFQLFGSESN